MLGHNADVRRLPLHKPCVQIQLYVLKRCDHEYGWKWLKAAPAVSMPRATVCLRVHVRPGEVILEAADTELQFIAYTA